VSSDLQRRFYALDLQGTGTLTLADFLQAAEQLELDLTAVELEIVFRICDIDGSGEMSMSEFLTAATGMSASFQSTAELSHNASQFLDRRKTLLQSTPCVGKSEVRSIKWQSSPQYIESDMLLDSPSSADIALAKNAASILSGLKLDAQPHEADVDLGVFGSAIPVNELASPFGPGEQCLQPVEGLEESPTWSLDLSGSLDQFLEHASTCRRAANVPAGKARSPKGSGDLREHSSPAIRSNSTESSAAIESSKKLFHPSFFENIV